ncbi:PREDICTED: uncharacterized protein LOC109132959 [Camelina sativa]|uniref:Uncharacterized protein LOC109132959 n=1 Tax=Camelina sativa TaxID=90675 RepID=A0ABM1RPR4_CAMSA|nr:PREDICTED: uncharacterized protein LOC109132959 [Camelina sativa]
MEKKVALVMALMLLMSMLVSAEEAPTVGQHIDSATTSVGKFWNDNARPAIDSVANAVESVTSTVKSVYGWFHDRATDLGL